MVQQVLIDTIAYLAEANSIDGKIDIYSIGEDELLANTHSNVDTRFATLQFALISHLLETVKAANDQISVGLEINKLMWFHGMEMSQDKEFWRQKYKEHGAAMTFGFDSATVGSKMAIEVIKEEVKGLNATNSPLKKVWGEALQKSIDKFSNERSRLQTYTATYNEVNEKIGRRESHYSESQRPENAGTNLSKYFLNLHRNVGARSAEDAVLANVQVAKTLLVRGSFLEQRVIPTASLEDVARLSGNVVKMRDNVTAALERAVVWLDVQANSEEYHFPPP